MPQSEDQNKRKANKTKKKKKAKKKQPWNVVGRPSDTSLKKTGFPFASRCQLQIVSWLGLEPYVYFPLSLLGPCLT